MSKVTLNIFQPIAERVGVKAAGGWQGEISIQNSDTLGEALEKFSHEFRVPVKEVLIDPGSGRPRGGIALLVNGRNFLSLGGLEARLTEGDTISLVPAYGGG